MESNDIQRQLVEANRLASATRAESLNAAAWAWPVMVVAMIAFFALMGVLSEAGRGVATVGWTLFVIVWIITTRRANRARPRRTQRDRSQRIHDLIEWLALAVTANAIFFGLSHVSWTLAGIGLALLGAGYGAVSARRATHA